MMWEAGVRYPYRFAGCIGVSGLMREAALSLSILHLLQLEVAEELSTAYQKALAANAFLARDQNDAFGRELANQIKESIVADGQGAIHWTSVGQSVTYSRGDGMDVETTALSAMALMKAGLWPESVKQALGWISRHKTANGTWGSTQATILAMRARLAGSAASFGQEFDSAFTVPERPRALDAREAAQSAGNEQLRTARPAGGAAVERGLRTPPKRVLHAERSACARRVAAAAANGGAGASQVPGALRRVPAVRGVVQGCHAAVKARGTGARAAAGATQ